MSLYIYGSLVLSLSLVVVFFFFFFFLSLLVFNTCKEECVLRGRRESCVV